MSTDTATSTLPNFNRPPRILVVKSAYRKDIIDMLEHGATDVLHQAYAKVETLEVHGSLEIPAAISYAAKSSQGYDGFLGLGCILKGATIHDEVIAYSAYKSLLDLETTQDLAIGCGILTVNTEQEAYERAHPQHQNRGAEAAIAVLGLIHIKQKFGL
ncbi:MAG: 6,7-dimethyl-8-ribityllumazine synthase [Micavibrio sp.]|nr:6,7-dimethyl-8-ribityllumazine synthase [Micavibrio sp.]